MAQPEQSTCQAAAEPQTFHKAQPIRYAVGMGLGLLAVKFARRKLRGLRKETPSTGATTTGVVSALGMVPTVLLGSALGAAAVYGLEHTCESKEQVDVGVVLKERKHRKHHHHHGYHHHHHHDGHHGHHHEGHHHHEGYHHCPGYHYDAAEQKKDLDNMAENQAAAGMAVVGGVFCKKRRGSRASQGAKS